MTTTLSPINPVGLSDCRPAFEIAWAHHLVRGNRDGFKPLTETRFMILCRKIEAQMDQLHLDTHRRIPGRTN